MEGIRDHLDALGDVGVGGLEITDGVPVESVEVALEQVKAGRGKAPQVVDGGHGDGVGHEEGGCRRGERGPGLGRQGRRGGREEAAADGDGRRRRVAGRARLSLAMAAEGEVARQMSRAAWRQTTPWRWGEADAVRRR